jgi:hypothetical protein
MSTPTWSTSSGSGRRWIHDRSGGILDRRGQLASTATQAAAAVENARRREEKEEALHDHRRTFIGD